MRREGRECETNSVDPHSMMQQSLREAMFEKEKMRGAVATSSRRSWANSSSRWRWRAAQRAASRAIDEESEARRRREKERKVMMSMLQRKLKETTTDVDAIRAEQQETKDAVRQLVAKHAERPRARAAVGAGRATAEGAVRARGQHREAAATHPVAAGRHQIDEEREEVALADETRMTERRPTHETVADMLTKHVPVIKPEWSTEQSGVHRESVDVAGRVGVLREDASAQRQRARGGRNRRALVARGWPWHVTSA